MRFPPQSPVISFKDGASGPQEADRYAPFPLQSFGTLFGILIELLVLSLDCPAEWFSSAEYSGSGKTRGDRTLNHVQSPCAQARPAAAWQAALQTFHPCADFTHVVLGSGGYRRPQTHLLTKRRYIKYKHVHVVPLNCIYS
ncbi:uncharacterized [Tachysurus ichikawai]